MTFGSALWPTLGVLNLHPESSALQITETTRIRSQALDGKWNFFFINSTQLNLIFFAFFLNQGRSFLAQVWLRRHWSQLRGWTVNWSMQCRRMRSTSRDEGRILLPGRRRPRRCLVWRQLGRRLLARRRNRSQRSTRNLRHHSLWLVARSVPERRIWRGRLASAEQRS